MCIPEKEHGGGVTRVTQGSVLSGATHGWAGEVTVKRSGGR